MAEIDITRKERPWWPVMAALALVLIVGILVWAVWRDPSPTADDRVHTPVVDAPSDERRLEDERRLQTEREPLPAVREYREFLVRDGEERMGLEHEFSSDAIDRLAGAIEAVAVRPGETNVAAELETMRERARELRESPPDVLSHARMVREAFASAARAIGTVQQERFPGDADLQRRVAGLERDAEEIDPDEPLLQQRPRVRGFLTEAGDILEQMPPAR